MPIPTINIGTALADPQLLGSAFAGPSWDRWRAILKAAFAEPMADTERKLFREVAERDPPRQRVRELWVIAGRRAGKDSVASAVATVAALGDYREHLRPGERATVMCLAVDREQARIVKRYIAAYFSTVPLLMPLIDRATDDGLELTNGVEIVVSTNNYRSVRGRTIICAIFDECAYLLSEGSATPDVETYAAVLPGLVTLPGAMLIGISTPYRRTGLLFDRWRRHYGKPDDDVLVVRGPSTTFNPSLPQIVIDAALERDPQAAAAEWLAEWRVDIADYVSREIVESCIEIGCHERPPARSAGNRYVAFVDAAGGSGGDSMTVGIAHLEDKVPVLDAVRERRPPFSPDDVTHEFSALLKSYGISSAESDRWGGDWVGESFRKHGIKVTPCAKPKSDLYKELLPLLNAHRCQLVDNPRLVAQLCALERRTARGGRDSIDHPPGAHAGAHDDLANVACGALLLASSVRQPMIISSAVLQRLANTDRYSNPRMYVGPG